MSVRFVMMAGLLFAFAGPAVAADQGVLGARSTGSVMISASVAPQLQATDLPATMASSDEASPCIWINTVTHRYDLRSDTAISWSPSPTAKRIAGHEIDDVASEATSPGCRGETSTRARLALTGSASLGGSTTLIVSPR